MFYSAWTLHVTTACGNLKLLNSLWENSSPTSTPGVEGCHCPTGKVETAEHLRGVRNCYSRSGTKSATIRWALLAGCSPWRLEEIAYWLNVVMMSDHKYKYMLTPKLSRNLPNTSQTSGQKDQLSFIKQDLWGTEFGFEQLQYLTNYRMIWNTKLFLIYQIVL